MFVLYFMTCFVLFLHTMISLEINELYGYVKSSQINIWLLVVPSWDIK